jgi:hypothetical protein
MKSLLSTFTMMKKTTTTIITLSSSRERHSYWRRDFLVAYLLAGLLHELSHLSIATTLLGYHNDIPLTTVNWVSLIIGRSCTIPSLENAEGWEISLVRHAGWIASVFLSILLVSISRRSNPPVKARVDAAVWAFLATALEALSTDLFGYTFFNKTTFLCGNFGVILLNSGWTTTPDDYGKTALDLLEKMIEITMMRGAQTGGVVTWTSSSTRDNHAQKNKEPTPVRVRVVNGKRTDLSDLLRKALNRKVCSRNNKIDPSIRCLLGHTRFATSSKATMDGTHPHQWSPPEKRRIYPLDDVALWRSKSPSPVTQVVTNFISK